MSLIFKMLNKSFAILKNKNQSSYFIMMKYDKFNLKFKLFVK